MLSLKSRLVYTMYVWYKGRQETHWRNKRKHVRIGAKGKSGDIHRYHCVNYLHELRHHKVSVVNTLTKNMGFLKSEVDLT